MSPEAESPQDNSSEKGPDESSRKSSTKGSALLNVGKILIIPVLVATIPPLTTFIYQFEKGRRDLQLQERQMNFDQRMAYIDRVLNAKSPGDRAAVLAVIAKAPDAEKSISTWAQDELDRMKDTEENIVKIEAAKAKLQSQLSELGNDVQDDQKSQQRSDQIREALVTQEIQLRRAQLSIGATSNPAATNSAKTTNRAAAAAELERTALENLMAGRFAEAMANLKEIGKVIPGYHTAHEIAKYLKDNPTVTPKEACGQVARSFSWGIPDDLKEKLARCAANPE